MAWRIHKNKLWSVLDVVVAALLVWRGVEWIRVASGPADLPRFALGVLGFHVACFGVALALTAAVRSAFFALWIGAVYTFIGRGIALLFFGSLSIRDTDWPSVGSGVFILAVGIVYIALQFVSSVPAPEPLFWFGRHDDEGVMPAPGKPRAHSIVSSEARRHSSQSVASSDTSGSAPLPPAREPVPHQAGGAIAQRPGGNPFVQPQPQMAAPATAPTSMDVVV